MNEYGIIGEPALSTQSGQFELGWVFEVGSADIPIKGLRTFLPVNASTKINLWSNANARLATVTVVSIVGEWVEGEIEPLLLLANTQYKVTAFSTSRYQGVPSELTFNDKLTFITGCGSSTSDGAPTFTENKAYPLVDIVIGEAKKNYKTSGSYQTPLIINNTSIRIKWIEEKPIGTNIVIEYATEQNSATWNTVENAAILNVGNIYLRATLSTTDVTITPKLIGVWFETANAPQDTIVITTHPQRRFNNVEGNLTVNYDQAKGTLTGSSGFVESFEVSFLPTDLEKKVNPNETHKFKVNASTQVDFTKIGYKKINANEKFKVSSTATVVLTYVGVVNP